MNQDEVKGRAREAKGKMKQAAGELTDDERLHDEGVADKRTGEIQKGAGRARRKVGETIEDVGDKLKG